MEPHSTLKVQKAKKSLVKRLIAEPGFVGAGVAAEKPGEMEIVVMVKDASSPILKKVPPVWKGVSVRTQIGGVPKKF